MRVDQTAHKPATWLFGSRDNREFLDEVPAIHSAETEVDWQLLRDESA